MKDTSECTRGYVANVATVVVVFEVVDADVVVVFVVVVVVAVVAIVVVEFTGPILKSTYLEDHEITLL